jgi:hypothetical protein
MAQVKLIKSLIGSPIRRSGQLIDVTESQAIRLIEAGIAIPVQEKREKAIPNEVTEKRAVQGNRRTRRRANKPK